MNVQSMSFKAMKDKELIQIGVGGLPTIGAPMGGGTGSGGGSYPPSGGVPKTDLASSVQASLDKADSAIQPMAIAQASGTTLTAQVNTLYLFNGSVNTLAITLPAITDTTHTHEIEFIFGTGGSPAITFTDAGGGDVRVQGDLVISGIARYELNALWAGQWIVAGIKLYQSGK